MKKNAKKLFTLLCACAVMTGCLLLMTTEAKAAGHGPEKRDAKKGLLWNASMRVNLNTPYNSEADILIENPNYYIASVKSSSSHLIAKVVADHKVDSPDINIRYDEVNNVHYKRYFNIAFYATKKGKYTVTFTVKNASKKTVAKRKITVYAGYPNSPVKTLSYAGTKHFTWSGFSFTTKKASGKLKLVANDTYKIKKIEIATTYDENGEPIYKKIKNGSKIKLATKTTYQKIWYESDTYRTGCQYDFLKPMTKIRVTYYDRKLKTTGIEEYSLFNIK